MEEERYGKNDWVACVWGDIWWVGQVQEVMVEDDYVVKFMHPVSGSKVSQCHIDWPDVEDITAIPHGDILCEVSKPVPTVHGARWCFTLPKNELKCVRGLFDKVAGDNDADEIDDETDK